MSNPCCKVLLISLTGACFSLFGQNADPLNLLKMADRFADFYNWADAGPIYEQAEQLFNVSGDTRNSLYAKIGFLRSSMESSSLPELSGYIADQLATKAVQDDRELKFRCLEAKGDVDGEIDTASAVRDWTEVLAMAKSVADRKLTARATGELAILAFLQGRMQDARPMIATAILQAKVQHDVGAEVRFLSSSGTGLVLLRAYTESLQFFDQALALAKANPDTGVPFTLYWGKSKAMIGLNRMVEAQALVDLALKEARDKDKRVKEAQFLITASTISETAGNHDRAIELLGDAAEISRAGGFRRLLETAYVDLADIYRARNDLATAERYASAGVEAARSSGELYLIPYRLTGLAELKTSLRKFSEADDLYSEAADVIDGMLLNAPDARTQVGLLTTMSETYTEHFALAATDLHDPDKAFTIVEQVRGRSLNDLLRGSGPGQWAGRASPAEEREISRLRLRLVNAGSIRERKQTLQALFYASQTRMLSPGEPPQAAPVIQEVPSLTNFRSKLRPDEVLLEYVLRDPASFCLVATRESARIVQLPGRAELEKAIDTDLKSLKTPDATPASSSHALYLKLLGEIPEARLKPRMIVVPDGKLHLVPFGSLVDDAGHFLVASRVISYASSATSLYLLASEHRSDLQTRSFLGVGGVEYGPDRRPPKAQGPLISSASRGALYGTDVGTLPPLPGSEDEVREIAKIFGGGTTLIGTAATKAAFESQPLDRYMRP